MEAQTYTDKELQELSGILEVMEDNSPKYSVIDLPAADEQEAYSMVFEGEQCPDCKSMPNNPRRSNDGLYGLATGTNFMYTLELLTQTEADARMLTANWCSTTTES